MVCKVLCVHNFVSHQRMKVFWALSGCIRENGAKMCPPNNNQYHLSWMGCWESWSERRGTHWTGPQRMPRPTYNESHKSTYVQLRALSHPPCLVWTFGLFTLVWKVPQTTKQNLVWPKEVELVQIKLNHGLICLQCVSWDWDRSDFQIYLQVRIKQQKKKHQLLTGLTAVFTSNVILLIVKP